MQIPDDDVESLCVESRITQNAGSTRGCCMQLFFPTDRVRFAGDGCLFGPGGECQSLLRCGGGIGFCEVRWNRFFLRYENPYILDLARAYDDGQECGYTSIGI